MILLCLGPGDDEGEVRSAARGLAESLGMETAVTRPGSTAASILETARRGNARHLIWGRNAWATWGKAVADAAEASGELALSWALPTERGRLPGLSLERAKPSRGIGALRRLLFVAALALAAPVAAPAEPAPDERLKARVEALEKRLSEFEAGKRSAKPRIEVPQSRPAPFAFADFTWVNGNGRVTDPVIDNEWFTSQFMFDVNYTYSFNAPRDHSLVGACEVGRTNEIQLQQLGIGGDLHYGNVRGRVMTQFGMYSQMTPRNDSSPGRGQWNLDNAYRYVSEGYGGYHWDVLHGVNLDAGLFMSYVGLFSYYQNENWAYTPSYVSANTPWFFNGLRAQIFPTERLKIETWLVNGFQTYGKQTEDPGIGVQALYRPNGSWSLLSNNYWGHDTANLPRRQRWHTDNSALYKYYDRPEATLLSKAAVSLTVDLGCEEGDGVSCWGVGNRRPQNFVGWMAYNRLWLHKNLFGVTLGGGSINNPGRYLVLTPPINGATAFSGTSGQFTQNPGDKFRAWDMSATFDYMPSQYVTWRAEYNHREANVPYFAGRGGLTPPGGNQGAPGSLVAGFTPDLRKSENRITLALLVRM